MSNFKNNKTKDTPNTLDQNRINILLTEYKEIGNYQRHWNDLIIKVLLLSLGLIGGIFAYNLIPNEKMDINFIFSLTLIIVLLTVLYISELYKFKSVAVKRSIQIESELGMKIETLFAEVFPVEKSYSLFSYGFLSITLKLILIIIFGYLMFYFEIWTKILQIF